MRKEVQRTRKKEVLYCHFVETSRLSLTTVSLEVLLDIEHFTIETLPVRL